MSVSLVWVTPDADKLIAYMARVSNPANQGNDATAPRLINYCIRNAHWSIFEMADMCVEVNTTRDIGRQILRHRSFSFQEFSQRYADVSALGEPVFREARLQDAKNRQNSTSTGDPVIVEWWQRVQQHAWERASAQYQAALDAGIAKEQARALLPEGLTPTRFYMKGSARSWIHYCGLRRGNGTQREHRDIADAAWQVFKAVMPAVAAAVEGEPQGKRPPSPAGGHGSRVDRG